MEDDQVRSHSNERRKKILKFNDRRAGAACIRLRILYIYVSDFIFIARNVACVLIIYFEAPNGDPATYVVCRP